MVGDGQYFGLSCFQFCNELLKVNAMLSRLALVFPWVDLVCKLDKKFTAWQKNQNGMLDVLLAEWTPRSFCQCGCGCRRKQGIHRWMGRTCCDVGRLYLPWESLSQPLTWMVNCWACNKLGRLHLDTQDVGFGCRSWCEA